MRVDRHESILRFSRVFLCNGCLANTAPSDIFLGADGSYFDLKEKYARWKAGDRNAFIDPDGYKAYIADREQAFEDELKRQTAGAP